MAKRTLTFWDVDTQVDFMLPGGKLYVPGAEKLIPNLKRLMEAARQQRVFVVSSADSHGLDDEEFRQYPPHCLAGTHGQEKVPETLLEQRFTIPNQPTPLPAQLTDYKQVIIEKEKFDVFTNPNVETLLEQLGLEHEFVVFGVTTEICVAYAVRGLLDRGYAVRLVRDATESLDKTKARALFEEVQSRGGKLVTTKEVLRIVRKQK